MRARLFWKIYATVLGAIATLALAGGLVGALFLSRAWEEHARTDPRAELMAAALPEGGAAAVQAALERIAPAAGAWVRVRDAAGDIVAAWPEGNPGRGAGPEITAPLPSGGTLAVRFTRGNAPPFGPMRRNPLFLLAFIAGLTALVAWPVVRHLTRRLEHLRHGVESWGEGDLSLRIPVEGRDEIAAVADSFNAAAARVEALVEANRALLANASHELRSPLARLRMAVDLHEAAPDPDRRAEIARNLAELDELVGEILLSSRLAHGAPEEPFRPLDLLALAVEEAARAGVAVSGDPVEVTGDARLLSRLLRNLIQNALRHGRPPVTVQVARRGAEAVLSVRDHGPGVPEADRARVFEPFYRPSGYGESAGGWGLGLALVRQIATHHGGEVHVDPLPGGARFVVVLPVAADGAANVSAG
ncbi:MAG: HAMP domain-containing histidine kinase [Rubellimicrobium sp.]|nr:HAMP domain-containing histidine kinase [Rubellimicrobium sp.]